MSADWVALAWSCAVGGSLTSAMLYTLSPLLQSLGKHHSLNIGLGLRMLSNKNSNPLL
jgi:hypothetical protein